MKKERLEALKVLANSNIHKIFKSLGIIYSERYEYLNGPCAIHGGDNITAFSWHLERGIFKCFTNGCDKKYGSDIFGLIRGIKKLSFSDAALWIDKYFKDANIDVKDIDITNSSFVNKVKSVKEKVIFDEGCLSKLSYHSYLEGRGYPRELIEKYHIGMPRSSYKQMSNRIIFPIRDISGQIVGFSGRTVFEDYKNRGIPKWYHSRGLDKASNLFNIDKAKIEIEKTGVAIVTEGPLDVLRLEQAGFHNGVALMGISMTNKQMGLLIEAGASTILMALDNDNAGNNGAKNIMQTAQNFFNVRKINLPDGKDIGDLSVEAVKEVFGKKYELCA